MEHPVIVTSRGDVLNRFNYWKYHFYRSFQLVFLQNRTIRTNSDI